MSRVANKIRKYFELEKLRDSLAKAKKTDHFAGTYSSKLYIDDLNTEEFWSKRIINKYKTLMNSPIYRDKLNVVSKLIVKPRAKVLDIGIGYGHLEKKLVSFNNNLQLFGVDISPAAIDQMKKLELGEFKVAGIFNLPYKSMYFDYVVALDVLEHLPPNKVFSAYRELYRVVKEGGYLVASVPLNEHLEQKVLKGKNQGAHLREYTPNIIRLEFKISKFEILEEIYLYAFRKYYILKKFLVTILPFQVRKPNQMIIYAQKR